MIYSKKVVIFVLNAPLPPWPSSPSLINYLNPASHAEITKLRNEMIFQIAEMLLKCKQMINNKAMF